MASTRQQADLPAVEPAKPTRMSLLLASVRAVVKSPSSLPLPPITCTQAQVASPPSVPMLPRQRDVTARHHARRAALDQCQRRGGTQLAVEAIHHGTHLLREQLGSPG